MYLRWGGGKWLSWDYVSRYSPAYWFAMFNYIGFGNFVSQKFKRCSAESRV